MVKVIENRFISFHIKRHGNLCNVSPFDVSIVQDDGVTAIPVFAHICTAPVFDDGGCVNTVSATINCSATVNLQDPHTAKQC